MGFGQFLKIVLWCTLVVLAVRLLLSLVATGCEKLGDYINEKLVEFENNRS